MRITPKPTIVAVCAFLVISGCDSSEATAPDVLVPPSLARNVLAPTLPAASDFTDPATNRNPYFPLIPGTVRTYQAETEDGLETTVVTVTDQKKTILGIQATVVLDEVSLDGVLIERTFDWFAQDRWGNVWYLGEDSCEFEKLGGPCNPAGSWEAGVDGAQAGIVMWAEPIAHKGKAYRQEFYAGEAEDMAKVLHAGLAVSVPAGDYTDCIETMDWTPLDPGAREHKFYCAGTGLVLEVHPGGGRNRNQLVSVVGL